MRPQLPTYLVFHEKQVFLSVSRRVDKIYFLRNYCCLFRPGFLSPVFGISAHIIPFGACLFPGAARRPGYRRIERHLPLFAWILQAICSFCRELKRDAGSLPSGLSKGVCSHVF
jgi:hypothetical protein